MKRVFLSLLCCLTIQLTTAQVNTSKVTVNYQNPLSQTTDLELTINEYVDLELSVVGGRGEFIKLLMKQELMPGSHRIPVVVSDIPTGDYMLKVAYGSSSFLQPFNVEHLQVNPVAGMPTPSNPPLSYGVSETSTTQRAINPSKARSNDQVSYYSTQNNGQTVYGTAPVGTIIESTTTTTSSTVNGAATKSRGQVNNNQTFDAMYDGGGNLIVYGVDAPQTNGNQSTTSSSINLSTTTKVPKVEFLNPVRSGNTIRITLDNMQDIELRLVDNNGKFIKLLMKQELMKGMHDIPVIVSDIPAGIYLLEIMTNGQKDIKSFQVVH